MSEFLSENFQFLVVKFSIYLNGFVYVMELDYTSPFSVSPKVIIIITITYY